MKKLIYAILILAISMGAAPRTAQAQTFLVDPGGANTNDGSLLHPWKTIVYAATQVEAGDTVLINPGIYIGDVYVDTGGTALEPVTFRANDDGVIIEGSPTGRDAFYIEGADYVVVEGITFRNAVRAGLRISVSDHVTIRNCTFADNGTWGMFTDFSDYTTVEDSESYGAGDEHGIYISNSSDYPTIRRNILHHNRGCGLHMNGDISMGGDGIISYGVVEQNIVYENGLGGGSGINMDGVTHTIVRNNLLYDNRASGISMYQIDGGSGSHDNRVFNNTILMPANGRWAINIPNSVDTNNKIYNNILYSAHSFRGSLSIASPTLSGFESDYNVVVNRFSTNDGNSTITLIQWQALGYDTHSFIAATSQLFVNPAAANFHLKADSPAIDHGLLLPEVSEDLEGNPRPSGSTHDIGALEHMQTSKFLYLPHIAR